MKKKKKEKTETVTNRTLLCECTIPGKPVSVNRVWRGGRGRVFKSAEARTFEQRAVMILSQERRIKDYEGACALSMEVWRKTRHLYDLDNCIKQIQDSIQRSRVIKDDSQIIELHAYKKWGDREFVRVELTTAEEKQMTNTQESALFMLAHSGKEICDIRDYVKERMQKVGEEFSIEVAVDEVDELLKKVQDQIDGTIAEVRKIDRDSGNECAGKRDSG